MEQFFWVIFDEKIDTLMLLVVLRLIEHIRDLRLKVQLRSRHISVTESFRHVRSHLSKNVYSNLPSTFLSIMSRVETSSDFSLSRFSCHHS